MAKDRKLVITGDQRSDIDAAAMALVLIRLTRQWLRDQPPTPPAAPNPSPDSQEGQS